MPLPLITIDRLRPGIYCWHLQLNHERVDEDAGDDSIETCLGNAVDALPPGFTQIEVIYCACHMGQFSVMELRKSAWQAANGISRLYGALVETA